MKVKLIRVNELCNQYGEKWVREHIIRSVDELINFSDEVVERLFDGCYPIEPSQNEYTPLFVNDYGDEDDMLEFAVIDYDEVSKVYTVKFISRVKG